MTTQPTDDDDETTTPAPPPTLYANEGEWFTKWFRHAMAGHFDNSHRWCSQWWDHKPVVERVHEMWRGWEKARTDGADDGAAMSAWWVYHADAHWRAITAPDGPLHQCTPAKHEHTGPLPAIKPPPGWFDPTT